MRNFFDFYLKGSYCEFDINECETNSSLSICQNNGTCHNWPGTFKCECKSGTLEYLEIPRNFHKILGFIGLHCQLPNLCHPDPNLNRTLHNCVHGRCVRPRVVLGVDGHEVREYLEKFLVIFVIVCNPWLWMYGRIYRRIMHAFSK